MALFSQYTWDRPGSWIPVEKHHDANTDKQFLDFWFV